MPEQLTAAETIDRLPFAAYAGSTIQQNYGETVDKHGFLVWDLAKKVVQAFDVPNSHSYHTIKVETGTDYDDLDIKLDATKHTHLKVQWNEFASKVTRDNQAKIARHLKERYKPVELSFRKTIVKVNESGHIVELSAERLADISSEANQKDIFTEYLAAQQYTADDITAILEIHDTVTERLKGSGYQDSPGYEFKVESLWIDNFKSYGDRVDLNWKGQDGVWQITGENTSGKSTILDAITYLFYGTMLGAMQAEKNGENRFINNIRDLDYCEVGAYVLVNGSMHKLVRRTERLWQNSKGERIIKSVSTSVNFYEVVGTDAGGDEILKDIGVDRKVQTEKVLAEYFGTMQDFMRSSFINADTLNGLFNITHSVFVDSLLRDIGLDVFERLLKDFKIWRDETHSKTKRIQLVPSQEEAQIEQLEAEIKAGQERVVAIALEVDDKQDRIDKGNAYIKEKYSQIQKVRPELESANPETLRGEIHIIVDRISQFYRDINVEEALLATMVTTYSQEAYDDLQKAKETHQEAVNGFKAKIRGQENLISKAQYQIQAIQGRMNVRARDVEKHKEIFAQQTRVRRQEIAVAQKEIDFLESSKMCPTCKRLKDEEAVTAIREVIAEKIAVREKIEAELADYPALVQRGLDQFTAEIYAIGTEKDPFEVEIAETEAEIVLIRAEQEASVLAVDEASQDIVAMNVQRAIYDKKQRREADLQQVPLRIENLKLQQASKVRLLEDLESAQDVLEANEALHTLIDRAQEKVNTYQTEKEGLLNETAVLERSRLPRMTQDISTIRRNLVLFAEQERQDGLLKAYEKCIHRDGIPTMLLKQYLSVINIQLANLLDNMKFSLFINEALQFKMFNHNREDAVMNVLQGSGMQKTFASLVLRLALRQVNNKCRNNMLLMDEILGKLDPNQLERFADLLNRSKEQIDKLVIIEHGYGDTISPDFVIDVSSNKQGISTLTYQ